MTFWELFRINLKDFREKQGLTQEKLAEMCGSNQSYMWSIEAGKKFPSPEKIEKIATALNVESYVLFQNKPGEGRVLTPIQREQITSKVFESVAKIVNLY